MKVEEFWRSACDELGLPADGAVPGTRKIGRGREMIDNLLNLIVQGEKTGTFGLADDLRAAGTYPNPGDFLILEDFDDEPRCLLQFERCEEVPFSGIGPEHVAFEGPGARDVDAWRRIHTAFWGPMLAERGDALTDDTTVLFQTFRVLLNRPAGS